MSHTTVAAVYSGLPVPSRDDRDQCHVLAISGGDLKVQQIILQGKFLLSGNIESSLIVGGHSGWICLEVPAIFLWPVDPFDNLGNDGVTTLGFYPVLVSKISEVLVLLHDLGIPDNHLLIYTFTLFTHMNVGRLRPGCTTIPGVVEELSNGFLI